MTPESNSFAIADRARSVRRALIDANAASTCWQNVASAATPEVTGDLRAFLRDDANELAHANQVRQRSPGGRP